MTTDVTSYARASRKTLLRYVRAVAAILTFLLACRWVNPFLGDNATYIILFPVVAFIAWCCGLGPSIVTITLALGGTLFLQIPTYCFASVRIPAPLLLPAAAPAECPAVRSAADSAGLKARAWSNPQTLPRVLPADRRIREFGA